MFLPNQQPSNFLSPLVSKRFRRTTTRANVSSTLKQRNSTNVCIFFRFLDCVCFQRQVINVPKRNSGRPKKNLLLAPAFSLSTTTEEEPRSASFNEFTLSEIREAALVERWTSSKLCRTSTQSHSGPVVFPSNDNNFPLLLHL